MSSWWTGKRILVTGGAGFIGTSVVDRLVSTRGVRRQDIVVPRRQDCDLRVLDCARRAVEGCQAVVHLAARTGGISYSRSHPASQYYDCALINLQVLEAARLAGVVAFVGIGNLFAYPANAPSPLREEGLYDGKIASTHLGIGVSKRDQVLMAEMHHREHGMNVCVVLSANAYGPRDRFDPAISHVIPATILKCYQERDVLFVRGDGTPTRDFLYVEDIAEGLLLAAERLRGFEVVNIASGEEISIGDLVRLIAKLTGFRGQIRFDPSKGGGDPKRSANPERATRLMDFAPSVRLEEGLRRTIAWYNTRRECATPQS